MKKLLAALVGLALLYLASPYAAVALVWRAVSQGDEEALASRIDFDALRSSLTEQLEARMTSPGETSDPTRRTLLPTLVNSFVTPRGFAMMLRGLAEHPSGDPSLGAGTGSRLDLDELELGWFFFTQPTRFEVESRRGTLVLEPRGAWWRVVDVKLATSTRGPALPTPPTSDFGAAAPSSGS